MNKSSNLKGICVNITGDCFVPAVVGAESYEDDLFGYGATVLNNYKKEILIKSGISQDLHEQELRLSTVELLAKYPPFEQGEPYIRRNFYTHCLVADHSEIQAKGYNELLVSTGLSDNPNPVDEQTSVNLIITSQADNQMFDDESFGTAYLIETINDEITVKFKKEFFSKITMFHLRLRRPVEEILDTNFEFLSLTFKADALSALLGHYSHLEKEEYSGVFEFEFVQALARAVAQYQYENKTVEYYLALANAKSLLKETIRNITVSNYGLATPSGRLTQLVLNELL